MLLLCVSVVCVPSLDATALLLLCAEGRSAAAGGVAQRATVSRAHSFQSAQPARNACPAHAHSTLVRQWISGAGGVGRLVVCCRCLRNAPGGRIGRSTPPPRTPSARRDHAAPRRQNLARRACSSNPPHTTRTGACPRHPHAASGSGRRWDHWSQSQLSQTRGKQPSASCREEQD